MSMIEIETRLKNLERSNRRLKIAIFTLLGSISVAVLAGAGGQSATFDSLTVNKLWVKERCSVGDEYIGLTDGRPIAPRTAIDIEAATFRGNDNSIARFAIITVSNKTGNHMTLSAPDRGITPQISVFDTQAGRFDIYNPQWIKKP